MAIHKKIINYKALSSITPKHCIYPVTQCHTLGFTKAHTHISFLIIQLLTCPIYFSTTQQHSHTFALA